MKRTLFLFLAILFPLTVFSQTFHPGYQDGRIWFKVKDDVVLNLPIRENPMNLSFGTIPGFEKLAAKYGVTNLSRPFFAAKGDLALQLTFEAKFTDIDKVENFISDLKLSGKVDYAEKVPLDKKCLTVNDPSYGIQWALPKIMAPQAWDYFSTGSTIKIAIVDDAVERSHPDLAPNLWVNTADPIGGGDQDGNGYVDDVNGYDVSGGGDNNPDPDLPISSYDHGTHVAGCASARSNNGTGVASIGFSCKIIAVKATNSPSSITDGYAGIIYAVAAGAHVINMSWGGSFSSTTAQNVCNYAWNNGAILVAAAGNDNVSTMFYPAGYNNVISVAATSSSDAKASFSNYGSWIDISSPGASIYSTTVGGTYGYKSGTSMASPIVAGLVGLMRSLNPSMPQQDIVNCLLNNADNINAMNPSYIGQLGSGRINAQNAMICVSSTLSNPPVANFVANTTSVTAGGSVVFTDLSTYSPTTWNWSFPGGTPASYVGQNPPNIVYNTPGTYNVTLTVSNVNGTNTHTENSYINVTAASGCLTMNYPHPGGWSLANYSPDLAPPNDSGWVNGPNFFGDQIQKAMYFNASSSPYTMLNRVIINFARGWSATPSKIVPIRIYDGTGATPGALLGTQNITMGEIMADISGNFYTNVDFVNNPITLPPSKEFFVSVDMTNICWTTGCHDSLSIVSNQEGQTTPSVVWEYLGPPYNWWGRYTTAQSHWNLSISLDIHPFLTNQNTVATFTPGSATICAGEQITFDATGSTYQDTLLWVFNGGTPGVVSSNPNVNVLYNTPGVYNAILYVVGGGCSLLDTSYATITVNANPSVSVTASPSATYCSGGSATLSASGASSYTWGPASGLSATSGTPVTANPATSTSYWVQGTSANGCTGTAFVDITVMNPPVASATLYDSTVVSCSTNYLFDGSGSIDATGFNWSFSGGSASNTATANPNVDFTSGGPQTATLVTTNICGTDSVVIPFNAVIQNFLNANFTASDTTIDCHSSIDFDAGVSTDATGYAWTFNGGTPSTSTTATNTVTYDMNGNYVVNLLASNSCGVDSVQLTITVLNNCNVGIENEVIDNLNGYLSYAMQGYVIEWNFDLGQDTRFDLLNELGQVISTRYISPNTNQVILPVDYLRPGMYIVRATGLNWSKSFKFILN